MQEIQLFISLYFIIVKIVLGLNLYERCTENTQCPTSSACRPYDCQGYTCLCDEGFVATDDKTKCLKGRLIGDKCSFTDSICMSPFAFCLGHCECMGVFQPTEDGRCKLPGMGFTGDKCDELSPCHPPAACTNNKCVCEYPYRPLTNFEYWVDPMHPRQCVPESYSPGKCNGTDIAIPSALQPTTSTTSTTTTTTTTTIVPPTTTSEATTTTTTTKPTTTTEPPPPPTTSATTTTKATTTATTTHPKTTQRPTTTTKKPTTTLRPTTSKSPTTTKRPTTTTQRQTTTTQRPTTTKRPTTTTMPTTTQRPTTTTSKPTTTKRQTTTTERQTITSKRRTTMTTYPTTTTTSAITSGFKSTKTDHTTTPTDQKTTLTEITTAPIPIHTKQNQLANLSTAVNSNLSEIEDNGHRNKSNFNETLDKSKQNVSSNRDWSSTKLNTTNSLSVRSIPSSSSPLQSKVPTAVYNVKPESSEYIMPTLSYRTIPTSAKADDIAPTLTPNTDFLSDTRTKTETWRELTLPSSTPLMSQGQTNSNIVATTASSEVISMHNSSLPYETIIHTTSLSDVVSVENIHTDKSLENKENPNSDSNFPTVPIFHIFSRTNDNKKIIKSENLLILKDTPAMEKTKFLMSGNTKSDSVSEEQKTTQVNIFSVNVATSVLTSEFQLITTPHTTTTFQPITTKKTKPLPPHLFVPIRPIVPIAVTLFDIGRELYSSCTQHSQCPEHAQCRPNTCQGYMCLCEEGYIASEDRKFCLRAIRNGERCDPRTDKCLSKFSMCAGVCKCLEFFEHTRDGRCKLPNAGYLGDDCSKRGCQYPSKCVDGRCRCVHPFRELSAEEFWISPQSTLQCRMHDYSLDKCNGSYIQVPRDLRPNITTLPQEPTESRMTTNIPNVTPMLPEADFPGEKPDKPEVIRSGVDQLILPISLVGVFLVNVIAAIIVLVCRRKRRSSTKPR